MTVPCKFCGNQTNMTGTQQCDSCWELRSRLESAWASPDRGALLKIFEDATGRRLSPNAPTRAPEPAKRYGDTALCAHLLLFIERYPQSPVTLTGGTDGEIVLVCSECGPGLTMAQFDAVCGAAMAGTLAVLPVAKDGE